MDISKEYIRMCEKAVELQKNWTPQNLDYIYSIYEKQIKNVDDIRLHWMYHKSIKQYQNINHIKGSKTYANVWYQVVWIPRQDQLQDILNYELSDLIYKFKDWNCASGFEWMSDNKFTSMEQLWLAFVMYEKYIKYWDGEKWESDFSKINNI